MGEARRRKLAREQMLKDLGLTEEQYEAQEQAKRIASGNKLREAMGQPARPPARRMSPAHAAIMIGTILGMR